MGGCHKSIKNAFMTTSFIFYINLCSDSGVSKKSTCYELK